MNTEQEAAMEARLAEDARRLAACDQIEALITPIRDEHPDAPLFALAKYLPQVDGQRLRVLLDELNEIVPFPVEPKVQHE